MPIWLVYCLGFLSWFPLAAAAVLVGRVLAEAREGQTLAAVPAKSPSRPADKTPAETAASPPRTDGFDEWAFAWASALT